MSIIGLDLGATKMKAGVVSGQKIIRWLGQGTKRGGTQKEIIKQIIDLLDGLVTGEVKAIGIGVPGLVDFRTGTVFEAVNIPTWQKVPLKKILEKKYQLPIYIDNDANCFALGEKHFGLGKKYNNLAAVTLGTGMGVGIIIEDGLYRGKNGGAGEFGQAVYQNGVFEQYTSGQFFERQYKKTGEEIFEMAKRGTLWAKKVFLEYGEHLGKALSTIVYAYDPEIIILDGAVTRAYDFFYKAMRESLEESSYKRTFSKIKILREKKPLMGVLGTAVLASGIDKSRLQHN